MDRTALSREGLQKAVDTREALGVDQFGPVDPYAMADALGVKVIFLGASMEGFYFKGAPSRILISSKRPVPRRAFTCAHELGHHQFGHGTTIDQLSEDERPDSDKPDEILANSFAAHLLMPTLGLRRAFVSRGWSMKDPTPLQIYTVACEFGVGYGTLISHLSFTLRVLTQSQRKLLEKATPQSIRHKLVGSDFSSLLVVDGRSSADSYDVELNAAILVPSGTTVSGGAIAKIGEVDGQQLFRAARRGESVIAGGARGSRIRVMPEEYEGAAKFRFLEDPDEND